MYIYKYTISTSTIYFLTTALPSDGSVLIQNKVGKPPSWQGPPGQTQTYSTSHVDVPVKDPQPAWAGIFSALPQTLGTVAVAAIKFITPQAPQVDRVDSAPSSPGRPGPVSVSEVRPLIDLEDPSVLTMGMLGVAAVTGLSYAVTSSLISGDSDDDEDYDYDDAESKVALNNFERYGAQYFLTEFGSKRSFENLINARVKPDNKKKRRRRSSTQSMVKPSKFYQPSPNSHLKWLPRHS